MDALDKIKNMHAQIKTLLPNANTLITSMLNEFDQSISSVENTPRTSSEKGFANMNDVFTAIFGTLQETDMTPTTQAVQAFQQAKADYKKLNLKWLNIKIVELPKLNVELQKAGLTIIHL